jgi:large-conductance mechanosensitive channel
MKNRLKYIKNKKANLIDFLLISFIIFMAIKVMNHDNFKDVLITYIHLDK